MKELLRLAGWGTAAAVALVIALAVTFSPEGQRQLIATMSGATHSGARDVAPEPPVTPRDLAQDTRLAATETEARRLSERLHELGREFQSERDRLLARIGSLERSLEDVTGSIKRHAELAAAAPPVAPIPQGPIAPPLAAPAVVDPPVTAAALENPPPAGNEPSAPVRPAASHDAPSKPDATEPAEAEPPADPVVGADIGGAATFDALRALWSSVRRTNARQLHELHPLVVVRENPRNRGVELRLIVGPLPDADAAVQLCGVLAAAKRYCQPVPFEGQQIALVPPEPPRRPAGAPERKPRPSVRPNP